jgi:hypothetical protein
MSVLDATSLCTFSCNSTFDDVSPLTFDVSIVFDDVSPLTFDVSIVFDDVSTVFDDVSTVFDDVSPAFEDVSPSTLDVSMAFDNVSPLTFDVSPLTFDLSSSFDDLSSRMSLACPFIFPSNSCRSDSIALLCGVAAIGNRLVSVRRPIPEKDALKRAAIKELRLLTTGFVRAISQLSAAVVIRNRKIGYSCHYILFVFCQNLANI